MKGKTSHEFRKKGRLRRSEGQETGVGKLLRKLRVAQGWTLKEAEKEANLSHRIIAKLEKAKIELENSVIGLKTLDEELQSLYQQYNTLK